VGNIIDFAALLCFPVPMPADTTAHLFFGQDDYRIAAAAKELVNACLAPEDQAFGLETIDGQAGNQDEAAAAIERTLGAVRTPALIGDKLVWLQNAAFLSDARLAGADRVKERLSRLAAAVREGWPAGMSLLITAGPVDKRTAFYKAFAAAGAAREFGGSMKPHEQEQEARARLRELTREHEVAMAADAAEAFLARVGMETRRMVNELEKLRLSIHPRRTATLEDVEAVVSSSRETPAWDLADAVGKRDLAAALSVTRQLLFQKASPIWLVVTVEGRLRELMVLQDALKRGWVALQGRNARWSAIPPVAEQVFAKELKQDPRKVHPYRAGLLLDQARRASRGELRRCLTLAVQAHEQLVSTGLSPAAVLERMLLEMLGERG